MKLIKDKIFQMQDMKCEKIEPFIVTTISFIRITGCDVSDILVLMSTLSFYLSLHLFSTPS